jgi:hypothetical protein
VELRRKFPAEVQVTPVSKPYAGVRVVAQSAEWPLTAPECHEEWERSEGYPQAPPHEWWQWHDEYCCSA